MLAKACESWIQHEQTRQLPLVRFMFNITFAYSSSCCFLFQTISSYSAEHLTRNFRRYVEENHLLRGRYAKISTDDRGLYFFTEGRRPEVKKYNPRSEVDHLSITTDKVGGFST